MPPQRRLTILVSTVLVLFTAICPGQPQQNAKARDPRITNVRIVSLPPTNDEAVTFVLGIDGENFPDATANVVSKPHA